MEERSEDFREALTNIARQARSLLENFSKSNVQPIEQRLVSQRLREAGVLSRIPASATSVSSSTGNVNTTSTAVAAQLRNLFPTVGSRSSGSKSHGSRLSSKSKKPPPKKAKKTDIVHKDVVLIPTPDTKSVPTHQTRCRLENNGFVVHGFPVDRS